MQVIGLDSQIEELNNMIQNDKLPKLLILNGQKGQGKKTLIKKIIKDNNLELYEVEENKINNIREIIEDSMTLSNKRFYLIKDADNMTRQAQNALLKIAEEPPNNCYIVITIINKVNLLDTIISRGFIYRILKYEKEVLKEFTDNEDIYSICNNIGQIKRLEELGEEAFNLPLKIINNLGNISLVNSFSITNKVFEIFGEDNLDLFFIILINYILSEVEDLNKISQAMGIIQLYKFRSEIKGVQVKKTLDVMFIELRNIFKGADTDEG